MPLFILIFAPIALLFCAVGWAMCKAAGEADHLEEGAPEPVIWPECEPEWERFMEDDASPRFPARHELRVHRREREMLPARRGDV